MEKKKIAVTVCGVILAAGCVVSAGFAVKANGDLSAVQGQIDTLTASNSSLSSQIEAANAKIETLENALPGVEVQALMKSAFEEYNKVGDMVKEYEITSKTDVAGLAITVSDDKVADELKYMSDHCPEGKYLPEDLEQIYITEREHLEETLIQSVRDELLKTKQGLIDAEAKAAAEEAARKKAEEDAKKKAEQEAAAAAQNQDSGNGGTSNDGGYDDGYTSGGDDYSGGGGSSTDSGSGGSDSGSGDSGDEYGSFEFGSTEQFGTDDGWGGNGDFSDVIIG